MKIVDLNVLLYATNRGAAQHARARAWWDTALASEDERLGLPWVVVLGFLRIATNPRIFPRALAAPEATATIAAWLSADNVSLVRERDDHWIQLRALLDELGTAGDLTTDAHLATLALTHDAILVSFDSDFARFPGLRWENPAHGRPAHTN